MPSRRTPLAARSLRSAITSRRFFIDGWRRRGLCLVLICGLIIVPDAGYAVSAATDVIVKTARDTLAPAPVAVDWFKRFFRRANKPRQETTAERSASVAHIRITPAKLVGYTGQQVSFSAIGSNPNGQTIQGAQFSWSSSNTEKLQIDGSGSAILTGPGLAWVTAATASASARVPVLIKPGARPAQSDSEWQTDQDQLRPDGTMSTTTGGVGALFNSIAEGLMPTAHAQTNGADSGDLLYDELWSEPRNLVGSPRNTVMATSAIGAILPEGSNFEFAVPLYSLAGRGPSVSLMLNYNSRIWSRHNSAITFNAVNSWPFLGFTLSFGRIVTYAAGANTKFILIDSDGTRHYLGGGPGGTTATYQTNDGSHITYVGTTSGGTLYYNSGVQKAVTLTNNRLLVTRVLDPNGNYLRISYASQTTVGGSGNPCTAWAQAIDSITDTLGRVIQFVYDSCNNLVRIDVPGYGGTSSSPVMTTIARFGYTTATPSSSFSGLTVENLPSGVNPSVLLSHVYFPATDSGYKFTYSVYNMITKVSLRKGMSYNSSTGAISDGTEKAYVSNNYPTTASSLTDAPSFSAWTQWPAATATGGTATWSVSTSSPTGKKVFTITNPDSTTLTLTHSDTSGTDYGLLTETEVKDSGGTSMAKSVISYTTDGGGQPQVANVVSYDELTHPTNEKKVDFDYDSYGNVMNVREYGHQQSSSWVVRRRTRTVYKTDTSYVNAYLRGLVTETDVYDAGLDTNDANDTLVAKTTFTYDNYSAMGGMEDYSSTTYGVGHLSSYDTTLTVRGNITATTNYTDVSAPTSITHYRKIDIFGNTIKEELTCCNMQQVTTDNTNGYAMPVTVTKGDPSGPTLTTAYDSDFNTSVQKSITNPDGQQTTYSRDAALRLTQTSLPTGATNTTTYDDSTLSVNLTRSYEEGSTHVTVTEDTDYDGWGRVIRQRNHFGGQINTEYDSLGRVARVSNPFAVGGSPSYWMSYSYDALGRQTTVTLPDSQTVTTSYSGDSVTVTDQVNRQMQRVMDGLGRLVTVYEQDSSGNLTQATNNTYDVLDNLTQVNQGNQLRTYRYDAMGRLMDEKIPEQGDPTQSSQWTTIYTYTDFNQVLKRTDARGVETHYAYDSLNRITHIWYTGTGGDDSGSTRPALPSPVAATPDMTYTYDTDSTYSVTATGHLLRINVGTDYQERYTFDSSFRVATKVQTIDTRSYTTCYSYNTGNQFAQITYPSGQLLYYHHDSGGMVGSISNYPTGGNGTAYVSGHTHNTDGQVADLTFGNGVKEVFGYDPARLQLTSQKAGTASPYTNRMDLTYTYNATTTGKFGVGTTAGNAGQLLSVSGTINGTSESASHTYDNYGRLVTSSQTSNGSSAQRRFVYDRWGNRTGVWDATSGGTQIQSVSLQSVSFPGTGSAPTNRISSVTNSGSTVSYSYDANSSGVGNGNVADDGNHTYTYDGENRLVSVDSGSTASYAYDQQNQRYKTVLGSSVTHYIWQDGRVMAEHSGSTGSALVDYIYGGSQLIAKTAGGTTTYVLSDRLSARLTLNGSGTVVGQQAHLPFGEDFAQSGTQQKQHLTSYERDSQTGTDYAVNRQYNQTVGRFQSADPFAASGGAESPQSWNRYTYVTNTPADFIDPPGLFLASPPPPDPCHTGGGEAIGDLAPTDPDIKEWFFPGTLIIEPTCDTSRLAIVPEGDEGFESSLVAGASYIADFVLTPRGTVKIPNLCVCSISGPNFKVSCTCLRGGPDPRTAPIKELQNTTGISVGEIKKRFPWLPDNSDFTWHHDGNSIAWINVPNIPGNWNIPNIPVPLKHISLN